MDFRQGRDGAIELGPFLWRDFWAGATVVAMLVGALAVISYPTLLRAKEDPSVRCVRTGQGGSCTVAGSYLNGTIPLGELRGARVGGQHRSSRNEVYLVFQDGLEWTVGRDGLTRQYRIGPTDSAALARDCAARLNAFIQDTGQRELAVVLPRSSDDVALLVLGGLGLLALVAAGQGMKRVLRGRERFVLAVDRVTRRLTIERSLFGLRLSRRAFPLEGLRSVEVEPAGIDPFEALLRVGRTELGRWVLVDKDGARFRLTTSAYPEPEKLAAAADRIADLLEVGRE